MVPGSRYTRSRVSLHSVPASCDITSRYVHFPFCKDHLGITVFADARLIRVEFIPTVPHCSLSTLIGLAIRYKIQREFLLEIGWRLSVQVACDKHDHAEEINKQLADKERVMAALENPRLINIIESITSFRM